MSKIEFTCPKCKTQYDDLNETYLNRCNKNKYGFTRTKCKNCGVNFYVTYNYMGDIQSFIK